VLARRGAEASPGLCVEQLELHERWRGRASDLGRRQLPTQEQVLPVQPALDVVDAPVDDAVRVEVAVPQLAKRGVAAIKAAPRRQAVELAAQEGELVRQAVDALEGRVEELHRLGDALVGAVTELRDRRQDGHKVMARS